MRRRCTPWAERVEAIKRGLSETVVYAAEVDYNQTVVHKTARQRYYCHLNGLAPNEREREREREGERVLPRSPAPRTVRAGET